MTHTATHAVRGSTIIARRARVRATQISQQPPQLTRARALDGARRFESGAGLDVRHQPQRLPVLWDGLRRDRRRLTAVDGAATGSSPGDGVMGPYSSSHGGEESSHNLFGDSTDEYLTDTKSEATERGYLPSA